MNALTRQAHVIDVLQRAQKEDRLAHAYLFFGGDHQDKVDVSKYFAKLVLDLKEGDVAANLIDNDQHPNVIRIKPESKNIKKEQVAFLKTEATKKAVEQGAKIYIIEQAEAMSTAATNGLLKFLEEPEQATYIVLMAQAKEVLLSTIVSRTINLPFKRLRQVAFDPELLDLVVQLETSGQAPEITLATHQSLLKDRVAEFLETYQGYYQQELDQQLASNEAHYIKSYVKKIRFALVAQANLKMNMNTQLCLDLFLQQIRDA